MEDFTEEELRNEEWRPAHGEPGYEVSNIGRVRSLYRSGRAAKDGTRRLRDVPKILAFNLAGKPDRLYRIVGIGQFRKVYVHHLVCSTFVAPRPGTMGCAHIDGNRLNNRFGNLAWKTQKANEEDKKEHGTWLKRITCVALTPEQIKEIRDTAGSVTGLALAAKFGVSHSTINRVRRGQTWKHIA